jgi:hypothetical protein
MISPTTNDQEKNSSELVVQLRFALLLRSQTWTAQFGRIHQPALRVALDFSGFNGNNILWKWIWMNMGLWDMLLGFYG